ncbi:DUF3341 domain-containing protein [Sphingobacteriales bacterium UPWRP_1]|nr:hypothetical protein B6N25_15305 [Sphingobacteriales bacterium TSM_CSS]PSJ78789.1 DUF3341 domain-containing protein [Sphingobacteriales bacterium UPWRP_1]
MKHKYLVGVYNDDDVLLDAVTQVRKEGYQMHEVFTPFPVHGLDEAMGLQDTRLHTIGFVFGAIGTLFALTAMSYIMSIDWKVIVGGKPFFSFPAYGPISFELTVLFASVGMTVVYYIRNGFSVLRDAEILDPRITDDKFVMAFCLKKYHEEADITKITGLLKQSGAEEVYVKEMENELEANLIKKDGGVIVESHHH